MSNEQYNKLLYFEYTENEIDSMNIETFEFINGIDFDNNLKSEIYYEDVYIYDSERSKINSKQPIKILTKEITKQQYENSTSKSGSVRDLDIQTRALMTDDAVYETSQKKLSLIITYISTTPAEKMVSSSLTWKTMPSTRSYDVFASRVTNGYFKKNTQNGNYNYTLNEPDAACTMQIPQNYSTTISSGNWRTADYLLLGYSGIGYTFDLVNDTISCFTDILVPLYSQATAMSTHLYSQAIASSSNNKLTVYSSYQHATSDVSYNNIYNKYNFSASGLGGVISFTNSMGTYYDAMPGVSLTY